MDTKDLQQLIRDGLASQKSGSEIAAKATSDIQDDATNPELKSALETGNATAKEWANRIERAIAEAGGVEDQENEIVKAHYEVSKKIRNRADTDEVRDLGIITSGQLALHYWISSFGTMASYTEALGLTETAQNMKTSVDEAKRADEEYSALAKRLLATK